MQYKPALTTNYTHNLCSKNCKIAIPTIDKAIGNVAKDFTGLN